MAESDAHVAVTRFGLGARAGELALAGSDPRGWLAMQTVPAKSAGQQAASADNALIPEYLNTLRERNPEKSQRLAAASRQIYTLESGMRCLRHIGSERPFEERLVMFWSNHFTVSVRKNVIASLANAFESEAIRPHVHGNFADMLLASTRHPAMLIYLDNAQSFGPDSQAGKRRNKGLNENLAREILELHSLGVNGGYSQEDVVALANIITGWTLARNGERVVVGYRFQAIAHQPGSKTLLGRTFKEQGEAEGIEALMFLARHPATARHIAFKLARHFIADQPPASAVDALQRAFTRSDGDLQVVSRTLIALDAAWQLPLRKFKNPYEYAVSAFRLTGIVPEPIQAMQSLGALNFQPFNAASPAGFGDTAGDWLTPDALIKRIEWSKRLAIRVPGGTAPMPLLQAAFAGEVDPRTRLSVQRAASGSDAIALLLASPGFQRR